MNEEFKGFDLDWRLRIFSDRFLDLGFCDLFDVIGFFMIFIGDPLDIFLRQIMVSRTF